MSTLTYRLTVQPPRAGLTTTDWGAPVTVDVSLTAENSEQRSDIQFSGEVPQAVDQVRGWLELEYGPFGHPIGTATSATDLGFAMGTPSAQVFSPELISGAGLLPERFPSAPKGTVF